MSRAEELRCLAERMTALAAVEEAIAVDFNTLVGPSALSRAASPYSVDGHTCCFDWSDTPRNKRSIGMAVSGAFADRGPSPRDAGASRALSAHGSVALDGAVSGLASIAAPTVPQESLRHGRHT